MSDKHLGTAGVCAETTSSGDPEPVSKSAQSHQICPISLAKLSAQVDSQAVPAETALEVQSREGDADSPDVIEISDDDNDDAGIEATAFVPPKRTVIKQESSTGMDDVDVDPLLHDQILVDDEQLDDCGLSEQAEHPIKQNGATNPDDLDPVDQNMLSMLQEFHKNNEVIIGEAVADIEDVVDSDEEDLRLRTEFAKLKKAYLRRETAGHVDIKHTVEYKQAEKRELARRAQRKGTKAYAEEEASMFFPERESSISSDNDVHDVSDDESVVRENPVAASEPSTKRGYAEISSCYESDDRMPSDREIPRGQSAKRGRRGRGAASVKGKTSGSKFTTTTSARGQGTRGRARGIGRGGGRSGKKKAEQSLFDVTSLVPYNVFDQANRNREAEPQPTFTAKNRQHALAELIASIPSDQRDLHIGDKKLLENSVKMFNGRGAMRADGAGKWKLKGMKTSLHHYQTIGAGKMRQRENEGNPAGGLLSDEMGLGKTVMAIANIVDGGAAPDSNYRATLIVTPAALQQQWYTEIKNHADPKSAFIKNILIYKSSAFPNQDQTHMLGHFDVVITSYHEVVKSYPKKIIPPELVTARAKEEWWQHFFEKNKGPLHQVKWHRIVLDEAQAIKNHVCRTSEGVWKLRGKYRWTLSGTPVVNSLEEFFAYFRFLKVFATGDFETWKRNFCKKGSEDALKRLRAMLEKMMIRRTHKDQLFGRPIIQLPPAKPVKTVELEFSAFERGLYKIVRDRFVSRIRSWRNESNTKNNYANIFILLLRLRQLTAHMLLIQKTLKDLLQIEDLEKLWSLTNAAEFQADPKTRAQAAALQAGLDTITDADRSACVSNEGRGGDMSAGQASGGRGSSSSSTSTDLIISSHSNLKSAERASCTVTEARSGFIGDISAQFQRCLRAMRKDGHWEKANARSLCPFCGNPPENPHVTSCLHIYCFGCLNELAFAGLIQGEEAGTCLECSCKFNKAEAYAAQAFDDASAVDSLNIGGRLTSTVRGGRKGSKNTHEEDIDWYELTGPVIQSTKTIAAVKQIQEWWEQNQSNKILLFSQFRGVLRVFSKICEEKGWGHAQFHGEMSFEARNKAIHKFSSDSNCRVLLAAMKAGGVGLNLTAANRVILIDLWWNVAMETQAYCRVFRIGQTRDVEVVRFAVKNTVDIDILQMQERKTKEIDAAMEKRNKVGGLGTDELLRLFGPLEDELGEKGDGDAEGGSNGRAGGGHMAVGGGNGPGSDDEPFIIPNDPYLPPDSDVEDGEDGETSPVDLT